MDVIFPPAFFRWKHAPTHTLAEINLSNPSPSITPCLPSCGGRDVALALQRCEGRGHGQGFVHPDVGPVYIALQTSVTGEDLHA